jgi:hypothetical protein
MRILSPRRCYCTAVSGHLTLASFERRPTPVFARCKLAFARKRSCRILTGRRLRRIAPCGTIWNSELQAVQSRQGTCAMGDWIDALSAEEETRRKEEELRTQSHFRRSEIIRKKKDPLWESLMSVIQRDVEKFRASFKGRRSVELTNIPGFGFRIYKTPFPTVLMEAEIPANAAILKVSYARTANSMSPMERVEETFELTVDHFDNLVIAHNGRPFPDLDRVSRFMLEPVFTVD